jgi:hypothetical protein
VWNGLRTSIDSSGHRAYQPAPSATSQGITWQGTYLSPITTEQRNNALPGETPAAQLANAWSLTAITRRYELDFFTGSSANKLYGVGGWFDSVSAYKSDYDTNPITYLPKGHMFVSLDGSAYNDFGAGGDTDPDKLINAIGLFCPTCANVPRFFGIIDTAGFNTFTFGSDQGTAVEYGGAPGENSEFVYRGPIVYADNFTFGGTTVPSAAPIPEPSTWATMMAGLLFLGLRLKWKMGRHP